ncbi:MAG: nitroreductase family protein [Cyanobacteria bacterium]|nr:nitroreductase family protein [Cyanobacteriota bacterium]
MSPTATVLDTLSAIEQRRSVKHYDPNFQMPESDVEALISAAILSPTSFNMQNTRFVLVKDPEQRQKIKEAAWNQAQVGDASLLFVLCADLKAAEKDPARYWKDAPQAAQDVLVPMIPKFYKDQPQLQRDEAMRSTGIASQTLMLAAKALGYDSCPMVGFDPVKVAEIIRLPEDHVISMLLVIGKAAKPAQGRGGFLPRNEVVIENHF